MYRFVVWAFFAIAPFSAIAEAAGLCSDNGQFECANGACVSVDVKCDGTPDCSDASDETHALCYNHYCHPSRFRCAYGGCVDGSAPCGKYGQCFDNSDIRLLRCRNKTAVVEGQFNCENGEKIQLYQLCDGEKNCADGTDESVRACAGRRCGKGQFQCKYGACVASSAMCDTDGHRDCADGSDEDDVICNRPQTVIPNSTLECSPPRWPPHGQFVSAIGPPSPNSRLTPRATSVTFFVECTPPYRLEVPEEAHCERGQWSAPIPECKLPPVGSNLCVLPYRGYAGIYTVSGRPDAAPEMAFDSVTLNVSCKPPFTRIGPEEISCYYGQWSSDPSNYCEYFCEVPSDPSVTYYCGDNFDQKCGDVVESGEIALPKCNDHYHSTLKLQSVKCFNNGWMFLQSCEPDEQTATAIVTSTEPSTPSPNESAKKCELPPYPEYGSYSVPGWPNARPGMTFDSVTVNVTCDAPMRPTGPAEMHCFNGQWSVDRFTSCWYFCEVPRHPSVTYYCGDRYDEPCDDFVISGTDVRPKCNEYFKSTQMMLDMHCLYGSFPFIETCDLDVRVSNHGNNLTLHLGNKLVLQLSGAQYSVVVDLNSETVLNRKIPEPRDDIVYDDVY